MNACELLDPSGVAALYNYFHFAQVALPHVGILILGSCD